MTEPSDPPEAARVRRNKLVGRLIIIAVGLLAAVQIGFAIAPHGPH